MRKALVASLLLAGGLCAQTNPLQIATLSLPTLVEGQTLRLPLAARGGVPPYAWTLVSTTRVDANITLPSDGALSIRAGKAGTGSIQVAVRDSRGNRAEATLALVVRVPLSLQPVSLPETIQGQFYSATISTVGGAPPAVLNLISGAIPGGLIFKNGTISGYSTVPGTFTFTVRATDSTGGVVTRPYSIVVVPSFRITTAAQLPQAVVGRLYSVQLQAAGARGSAAWALSNSTLPAGLTLSSAGLLSGTPSLEGNFTFSLQTTETQGNRSLVTRFQLTVAPPFRILTSTPLPTAVQLSAYNVIFRAAGGVEPYRWSAPQIPQGLSLSSTGQLAGKLPLLGSFPLNVVVKDATGLETSRSYTIVCRPAATTTTVGPEHIAITAIEQGPDQLRTIQIATTNISTMEFKTEVAYSPGADWLIVPELALASADQLGLLTFRASPQKLRAGTYFGQIRITGPGIETGKTVYVTLAVSPARRVVLPSPSGLTFYATPTGSDPRSQRVSVVNAGEGLLSWTATASTLSGKDWLTVTRSDGSSSAGQVAGSFTVRASPVGLDEGDHYGVITVSSPDAVNSPQQVTVVLRVRQPEATPRIIPLPAGVVLTDTTAQNIVLFNSGQTDVQFYTGWEGGQTLFSVTPNSGSIPAGGSTTVALQRTGDFNGMRRTALEFSFSGAESRLVDVVVLGNTDGGTTTLSAASTLSVRPAAVTCTPTQLVVVSTLLGSGFTVPAGWPTPVEVRVVDDCGQPQNSGSVTVSFSNGDTPISLISLGGGRWSGTWIGRNALTPQVTVTVSADDPETKLRGIFRTAGGVEINSEPPVVFAGGVVNAASLVGSAPVAPGSFISIFGSKLATTPATEESLPLKPTLGVTTVTLGGVVLPLQHASDGQINAVVPYNLPLNTPQSMLIRRGTALSVPEQVIITSSQPGIFTRDQAGTGQGMVVNREFQIVDGVNPAKPGEYLAVFSTGLGEVTPASAAGQPAPANPLAQTSAPVTAQIGGIDAEVSFSGLAPGFTGLYQVNVRVPDTVPAGQAVPLVVTVNGWTSPPVMIAVQR